MPMSPLDSTRMTRTFSILCLAALLLPCSLLAEWPQFRGPGGSGHAEGPAPPASFDATNGENVLWRVEVPGLGHSSPVVWGDLVYLTTAVTVDDTPQSLKAGMYGNIDMADDRDQVFRWQVLAFDRATGELVWMRTAAMAKPATGRHTKSTHADPTPAADAERIVASFGSQGFFAYDHGGQLLWRKDFGVLDGAFFRVPEAQWGYGTSPILADEQVIVQADVIGESFLAALDADTGEVLWRTKREDVPTWSTPAIAGQGENRQVLVNGYKHLGGYDFETGEPLWWMKSLSDIPVPTPQVADGSLGPVGYFGGSHGEGSPIYAVDLRARGDLTDETKRDTFLLWSHDRFSSYLPTHLVHGDHLYVLRDNGILQCFDRRTGKKLGEARIKSGAHTASPVAAGDRIYLAAETGEVTVVEATTEMAELGVGQVDDVVHATPAISDGVLFVRGSGFLTAVASQPSGD